MLKKLILLTASLLIGSGLYAQLSTDASNEVFKGANGAKTTLLKTATMGYPEFLSSDSRYICGLFGGASGYAYDLEKDTLLFFEAFTLAAYVAADQYVGQDDPGETYSNSFSYYKGNIYDLEKVIDYYRASYNEVFIQTVQSNGDNIVAMVYDTTDHYATGAVALYNRPAIYDSKNGKCRLQLPYVWAAPQDDDSKMGFGARGDCISGDGAIVGGHSTNPNAQGKWSLAFWDISDPNDIKTFGFGEKGHISDGLSNRDYGFGSFYGANYDGSLIVGGSQTNGMGVIVHYDRTNKAVTQIDTIAPLPSWDFLTFTDVANNGLTIGYCGLNLDPGTREPIVYSELTGLVKLTDFLYEYYNIDVRKRDLYTPIKISDNGSLIVGFFDDGGYPVPYIHQLSAERILPRARKISARAARGEERSEITWQEPSKSEHNLLGYNIYRDDTTTPLNANLLSASTLTYTDTKEEGLTKDLHIYYLEAVYSDGKSMKQSSNTIQVVGAGDAFPVQTLSHRVDYNRYAYIYWGLPSSEVVSTAMSRAVPSPEAKGRLERSVDQAEPSAPASSLRQTPSSASKSYFSTTLDYISDVDMLTYSGYAAIKIGDYYYTSSHLGGGITVIDQFNEVVGAIAPTDLGAVMSMVYLEEGNRQLLYCGTSRDIKVVDLSTEKIVETYTVPARFLAYVPDVDGEGHEGFVAGTAHSCNTYVWGQREDGQPDLVLSQKDYLNFESLYANGAAYHNGRLYVSSASGPYYNEVYIYDFAKKQLLSDPIQVVEDPAMYDFLTDNGSEYMVAELPNSTQAGGLSVFELEDGTTALGMVFQCMYFTTHFMILELESNAEVKGYDLYRSANGGEYVKVNETPMTSRRYQETLTPGQYTYYVQVISENAAPSAPSPTDTVRIGDQGDCPAPDLKLREGNGWAVLEWMPGNSDKILIGFDLYRDGEHLARYWNDDMRLDYVDTRVEGAGTYTYRLEALYEDGCMANATKEIAITGEGVAMAPYGLTLTPKTIDKNTSDVTIRWETPMFEEPLALRYCNGVQGNSISFDNFYECWAAIGWDKANLDLYRDLYLVGMEYLIGSSPVTFEGFVMLNDRMTYTQTISRPIAGDWQTVLFDQSFPMDQPDEVVVGYHTKYTAENTGLLLVDPSVSKSGYSDLVTLDGVVWSTLKAGGFTGSWMLGALVANKRDIEAAKRPDGTIDYDKLEGGIIRLAAAQPLNAKLTAQEVTFDAKPSENDALNLTGFNVYRKTADGDEEEVKLNDEILSSLEFTDKAVAIQDLEYTVGAVYADGQEKRASKLLLLLTDNEDLTNVLQLNLYPNPANEWVNVEGEYQTLQIFDFGGRLVRSQAAGKSIYVGDLNPGTYMLHFTGNDARKAVYKVVVR